MKRIIVFTLLLFLCFPVISFAHPGGTDKNGGHYHEDTNFYHYHHGYPAHSHYQKICPYYVAEIAYDTSYPWEFETFLDEYVDGFDLGFDSGSYNGAEDGYDEYYKSGDFFECEREYDGIDYDLDSPYAYGYSNGYQIGYCIEFEETYNDEAIYNEDDSRYESWEIDEVWMYANYETTDVSKNENPSSTASEDSSLDPFDIFLYVSHYGTLILAIVGTVIGFYCFIKEIR